LADARIHPPDPLSADVVVIGGGIVGAATALAAALRGAAVTLIERGPPNLACGSSRGGARIICPAPLPDASYLEAGLRALDGWRRIEARSGSRLLELDGAISAGTYAEPGHAALLAAGVAGELLTSERARRQFGVEVGNGRPVLFQPEAGVIRAAVAHRAILGLARQAGAALCHGTEVDSIADLGDGLEIRAGERRWRAGIVVLAAGPANRELAASLRIEAPLAVTAQTVAYFDLDSPGARPPVVMDFDGDEPYALWEPGRGLKAALHATGAPADSERDEPVDGDAAARIAEWVEGVYPGVGGEPASLETCKYTRTPDERFVIERHDRVVLASACNGQGFQFAPATGERVADLALESAGIRA